MAAIFEEFANGDDFNASDWNTYAMRQVLIACDNQTDRDSILTPQEGMHVYRKDLNAIQVYDGAVWRHLSPNIAGGFVGTTITTASTSYVTGSSVAAIDIEILEAGILEVSFSARGQGTIATALQCTTIELSGANTLAADDQYDFEATTGLANGIWTGNRTLLFTGLNSGLTTITMMHRQASQGAGAGTGTYRHRHILAKAYDI